MKMKKVLFLMMGIVMVAGFLACQTPAGRLAGDVVDDSTISTKVKAKLFEDDQLSGFAISVETFESDVTLTGAVDTPEQKDRATNLAQSLRGVGKVNNLLKVR